MTEIQFTESQESKRLRLFTGILVGAIAVVIFWAIGLPDIYQISWALAITWLWWWHFDPESDSPLPIGGDDGD